MVTQRLNYKSGYQLPARSILTWRIVQTAVWLVGARYFTPFRNHTCYLCNIAVNHSAMI